MTQLVTMKRVLASMSEFSFIFLPCVFFKD